MRGDVNGEYFLKSTEFVRKCYPFKTLVTMLNEMVSCFYKLPEDSEGIAFFAVLLLSPETNEVEECKASLLDGAEHAQGSCFVVQLVVLWFVYS